MRRLLFGIFWLGIFWAALMVAGSGIAGAMAGTQGAKPGENVRDGFQRGQVVGEAAGAEFAENYGIHVLIAATVLAALGTMTGKLPGTRPQR